MEHQDFEPYDNPFDAGTGHIDVRNIGPEIPGFTMAPGNSNGGTVSTVYTSVRKRMDDFDPNWNEVYTFTNCSLSGPTPTPAILQPQKDSISRNKPCNSFGNLPNFRTPLTSESKHFLYSTFAFTL